MTNPSSKLARWQMMLEQFDFEILYKAGKLNTNADALSRIEINSVYIDLKSELSEDIIRREQASDVIIQECQENNGWRRHARDKKQQALAIRKQN
jgi:hypothetical protein